MDSVAFDPALVDEGLDLLTDSRSLADPARTLFFALQTAVADGHRYIPELYARGVRRFVVRPSFEGDFPGATFYTAEPLEALQALG
ncbi:MAG: hypothetical protein NC210_08575, partial [[Clostridium] fimetarium]|nr:hypothetical protein [[Clostridium] fimetarium]